jgi:PAP2 superfamily
VNGEQPLRRRLLREAALLALLWAAYSAGRWVAAQHAGNAFVHADEVWSLQRLLHFPNEADLQGWLMQWPAVLRASNAYYAWAHFPATVACLAWLFVRHPRHYLWFRRVLASVTATALVVHLLYPLAPPRMLPQHGFVDTGVHFGQSVYGPVAGSDGLANQFAAMPSLHIGWALGVALALAAVTAGRLRLLWFVHPAVTVAVVVVTANHFWLDGLVSAVLVGLAIAVQPWPGTAGPEGDDVGAPRDRGHQVKSAGV